MSSALNACSVAEAEVQLRAAALQLEDRSARTYHYKNEYLLWDHCFLARSAPTQSKSDQGVGSTFASRLAAAQTQLVAHSTSSKQTGRFHQKAKQPLRFRSTARIKNG